MDLSIIFQPFHLKALCNHKKKSGMVLRLQQLVRHYAEDKKCQSNLEEIKIYI